MTLATPHPLHPPVLRIKPIQQAVAEYYSINPKEILRQRRFLEIARPRQVAMYLPNLLTKKTLPEIGRAFRKDHTTVIHALRRIEELIKQDEELAEDIMFLTQQLSRRNAA
jgi:chromosomal replication initiator protein